MFTFIALFIFQALTLTAIPNLTGRTYYDSPKNHEISHDTIAVANEANSSYLTSATQAKSSSTSINSYPVPTHTSCRTNVSPTKRVVPLADRIIFGAHIWGKEIYNIDSPQTWNNIMSPLNPSAGFGEFAAMDKVDGVANKADILEKAKQVKSANAFFLLTLQPNQGLNEVTDDMINKIVDVLVDIETMNVPVLLRPMHEMNGSWYPWGQKPIQHKSVWIRLATAIRCKAPEIRLVWSPNIQTGYPFGAALPATTDELKALDTNNDGQVNEQDDPFMPYYPGHEYVDWIGLSFFYMGPVPFGRNQVPAENFLSDGLKEIMNFVNSEFSRGGPYRPVKPFGIFETGASFYPVATDKQFDRSSGAAGEKMNGDIKISWINQLISQNIRKLGVALVMWFEFSKNETVDGVVMERDFAISRNASVLNVAKDILSSSLTTYGTAY